MPRLIAISARRLRASGEMSWERLRILRTLDQHGALRSGDLAQRWHLSAPAISHSIESLVRDGMVRRGADPSDRRAVILEITASGRRQLRRSEATLVAGLSEVLQRLDPVDRALLGQAIARLEDVLADVSGEGNKKAAN